MGIKINDIVDAIKKDPSAGKKLGKALQAAGVDLGGGASAKPGFKEGAKATVSAGLQGAETGTLQEEMKKALGPTNELIGAVTSAFAQISKFREASQGFFKSGYTGQMFNYAKSIDAAAEASYKLNGNFNASDRVIAGLRDNFKSMSLVSEGFTKNLMENSVVLEGAGFNMNQFATVIEDSVMAFNSSEAEVNKLTATLVNTSKQMAIAPAELTENFSYAQKNFAYTSEKMMKSFQGLQKMSKTTGVDFKSLATAFGSSMDTFDGSAKKAGQLNQILGKSVFNSIELLNMTEEERATKVRSAIMNSGRSIEQMGKFEILALKDSLGLTSVAETKKFLRGDLKLDDKGTVDKIKAADPVAKSGAALASSLEDLKNGIRSQRGPLTNTLIDINNAYRKHMDRVGLWGKDVALAHRDLTRSQQLLAKIESARTGGKGGRSKGTSVSGFEYKMSEYVLKMDEKLKGMNSLGQILSDRAMTIKALEIVGGKIPGINKKFGADMAVAFGKDAATEFWGALKGVMGFGPDSKGGLTNNLAGAIKEAGLTTKVEIVDKTSGGVNAKPVNPAPQG